jgi:hypothetical protein
MTKKLTELFELEEDNSSVNEELIQHAEMDIITTETYDTLSKIENALPQVRGLEASDTEMDELAEMATEQLQGFTRPWHASRQPLCSEIFN